MDVNLVPLLPAIQVLVTALVVVGPRSCSSTKLSPKACSRSIACSASDSPPRKSLLLLTGRQESAFGDSIVLDNFALIFHADLSAAAALTILSSIHYVRQARIHEGEFYALVLFATVGMILMAAANDLMVFFLGLGNHVHRGLCADRHVARERPRQRSVDEIFSHGRLCHRLFALRHRLDLRRHRFDQSQPDFRLLARPAERLAALS